jgi:hypothetical protein
MGSPLGGSSLTQLAPIALQRIKAAGPGRFKLKLRTRMPLSGFKIAIVLKRHRFIEQAKED